mgnify:FL=1
MTRRFRFALVLGFGLAASIVGSAPASAAPCPNGVGTSALIALGGGGCEVGDKKYSDFTFTGSWPVSSSFSFTNVPAQQHTFSGAGLALTPGSYSYSYKLTITPGNPGTTFLGYQTGSSTSDVFTPLVATKTFTGTSGGSTITSVNGGSPSPFFYSPTVAGPVDFTSNIVVSSGRMDNISDTVVQQLPASSVPGPLPILGVGAALGMSRKLRQRLKPSL